MVNQLNIFLLSFGALQGAVLSFFLLRKRRNDTARVFFALFLVVVGVQLTFKVFTKSWLWYNVNLLYLLSYSLPLLIGPAVYLFLRSRQGNVEPKPIDLLHGVPFVWHLLNTLSGELFNFYIIPGYIWGLPFPSYDLISLYAYGIAGWRIIERSTDRSSARELKQFLLVVMISETIILITIRLMIEYNGNNSFPDVRWLFITLTLVIYWLSYKLFEKPELFARYEQPVILKSEVGVKYAHSGLKKEDADRIELLVRDAIYKDQVCLDPSMSADTFAVKLGIPKHHLSRVINERFKQNFNDLVNGWRLEEARVRLTDPKYRKFTISTIAFDCGFSSVPSFNTMFRRRFQRTPSGYREEHYRMTG